MKINKHGNKKVRGKSENNGVWFYGYTQKYYGRFSDMICVCPPNVKAWKVAILYRVDEKTIGLCSGLKDKDNKEIYEGDIVRANKYKINPKGAIIHEYEIFKVKYQKDEFWIENEHHCLRLTTEYKLKVIGNIHDNPELLAKGRNDDIILCSSLTCKLNGVCKRHQLYLEQASSKDVASISPITNKCGKSKKGFILLNVK